MFGDRIETDIGPITFFQESPSPIFNFARKEAPKHFNFFEGLARWECLYGKNELLNLCRPVLQKAVCWLFFF
jgi:hypothetical protein